MKIGTGPQWQKMQGRRNSYAAQMNRRAVEMQMATARAANDAFIGAGISFGQESVRLSLLQAAERMQDQFKQRLGQLDGVAEQVQRETGEVLDTTA